VRRFTATCSPRIGRPATGTWLRPGGRGTTFRPTGWPPWSMALSGGWKCIQRTAAITLSCCDGC